MLRTGGMLSPLSGTAHIWIGSCILPSGDTSEDATERTQSKSRFSRGLWEADWIVADPRRRLRRRGSASSHLCARVICDHTSQTYAAD